MSLEDMGADQAQQKRLLEELNAGQNLLKKEREEVKAVIFLTRACLGLQHNPLAAFFFAHFPFMHSPLSGPFAPPLARCCTGEGRAGAAERGCGRRHRPQGSR